MFPQGIERNLRIRCDAKSFRKNLKSVPLLTSKLSSFIVEQIKATIEYNMFVSFQAKNIVLAPEVLKKRNSVHESSSKGAYFDDHL